MRPALLVCSLLLAYSAATAQDRCTYHTDGQVWPILPKPHSVFWCEDFDNYCVGAGEWSGYTPYPAKCAETGTTPDEAALHANWVYDSESTPASMNQTLNVTGRFTTSLPFSLHFPRAEQGQRIGRSTFDFSGAVQQINPAMNAVNGTDTKPLVFEVSFIYQPSHYTESQTPFYVELALGDDRAPTDFTWGECPPDEAPWKGPYPVICQQYRPVAPGIEPAIAVIEGPCGPLDTTPLYKKHASIAFGSLSFLDPTCSNSNSGFANKPTRDHAAIFDGKAWRELRSGVYPGTGNFSWSGVNDELNYYIQRFRLTVRTADFFIEHWNHDNIYSVAKIPREYFGPFSVVGVGTGAGCVVDPVTHECSTPRQPLFDQLDREALGCDGTYNSGREGDGTCTDDLDNDSDGLTDCNDPDCAVSRFWNDFSFFHGNIDSMVLLDGVPVSADGACCKPDGTCAVMGSSACSAAGGIAHGPGTACGGSICQGACCGAFGVCTDKAYGTCDGSFRGVGTSCAADGCPCPQPWADVDEDDDVDADDFGRFQECFNPVGISPGCQCYDRNGDSVVDGQDFMKFQSCATGPGIPLTGPQAAACELWP